MAKTKFPMKGEIRQLIIVITVFTLLDYILHAIADSIGLSSLFPNLNMLPSYYFIGKIIFLLIGIPIANRIKFLDTTFKKCIILAVLLQTRYFLITNYAIAVHLIMIILHYIMLRISFIIDEKLGDKI